MLFVAITYEFKKINIKLWKDEKTTIQQIGLHIKICKCKITQIMAMLKLVPLNIQFFPVMQHYNSNLNSSILCSGINKRDHIRN